MSKKIHHLHDKFVKASFSDPERAISFFERFLPATLLQDIDLPSLRVLQESYIQEDLTEHFSDIVFEVKTKQSDAIDIVLLFEHKSAPDKYVLIQVGHYMFSRYFKCISDKKPLKLIIPIIYYQGKKRWKEPNLYNIFPSSKGILNEYIPILKHIFIALSSMPPENIEQIKNGMMAAAVMAQYHAFDPIKLAADFQRIFSLFSESNDRGNFLEQLFVYIVNLTDIPNSDLKKAIDSIPNNIKDDIMTTYTRIKQEGEQIGIQKGEQIGIQKKVVDVVLTLNEDKIPIENIAKYTKLSIDEVMHILKEHKKL